VCADGIASTARSLLFSGIEPRYAGYVAWRGTVPEEDLTGATCGRLADAITYQLVPASHILVYPIPSRAGSVEPGQRRMNFVWYRNVAEGDELEWFLTDRHGERRARSLPPGAARDRCVDEIRGFAAEYLAPPIAEVVARTTEPSPRRWSAGSRRSWSWAATWCSGPRHRPPLPVQRHLRSRRPLPRVRPLRPGPLSLWTFLHLSQGYAKGKEDNLEERFNVENQRFNA
jgi:2-polyprenyl-6-methoxyphenol hydroxylase-like FAD-dependent oxidoreductase